MGSSLLGNFWVLGDPFMRGFTVAFDIDNYKMGFVSGSGTTVSLQGGSISSGGHYLLKALGNISLMIAGFLFLY
jgi:hypothetical protein